MAIDPNAKFPKTPGQDPERSKLDARYVESFSSLDGAGHQKFHPQSHEEALQLSFEEHWNPTGGLKTIAAHPQQIEIITQLSYDTRNYNINGFSQTGEASGQIFYNDTMSISAGGDVGIDTKGKIIQASARERIDISGGSVSRVPVGSDNHKFESTAGDKTQVLDGNLHSTYKEDRVVAVGKNDINMVNEGDYAMHVQSGNWDTDIAKKARFYSGDDILIESETKITLKVGNSRIIIEPNHIQIISNNKTGLIDLN